MPAVQCIAGRAQLQGGRRLHRSRPLPVLAWPQSSAPNRCQRWSFRARDGACRLFAPAASDVQPLALSVAAEDRAWYSGAGERLFRGHIRRLCLPIAPPHMAPGRAQGSAVSAARPAGCFPPLRCLASCCVLLHTPPMPAPGLPSPQSSSQSPMPRAKRVGSSSQAREAAAAIIAPAARLPRESRRRWAGGEAPGVLACPWCFACCR